MRLLTAWEIWQGQVKSFSFSNSPSWEWSTLARGAVYFRKVVCNAQLYDWHSFNNLSLVALYTWSSVFVTWHNWLLLASRSPRNRLAPNCLRWCGGYVGFDAVLKTGSRVDKPVSEHLRTQRILKLKEHCNPPPTASNMANFVFFNLVREWRK